MAEKNASIAVAVTSTLIVGRHGDRILVRAGDAWDAEDPFVQAHPDLFTTDAKAARRAPADVVEDKTANPGRKAQVKPRD